MNFLTETETAESKRDYERMMSMKTVPPPGILSSPDYEERKKRWDDYCDEIEATLERSTKRLRTNLDRRNEHLVDAIPTWVERLKSLRSQLAEIEEIMTLFDKWDADPVVEYDKSKDEHYTMGVGRRDDLTYQIQQISDQLDNHVPVKTKGVVKL